MLSRIIKFEDTLKSEDIVILEDNNKNNIDDECEKILQQALADAEKIRKDAEIERQKIIENANEQADNILLAAEEHIKKVENDRFTICISDIYNLLMELKRDQDEYYFKYSDELRFLAIEIAEKILAQKLEKDERNLFPLVRSAVKTLRDVSWIKVEISDKLKEHAFELENILKEAKRSQNIEIELRRDADIGTCVVHTADRVIVASVKTQIENIKEYFSQYTESYEE